MVGNINLDTQFCLISCSNLRVVLAIHFQTDQTVLFTCVVYNKTTYNSTVSLIYMWT